MDINKKLFSTLTLFAYITISGLCSWCPGRSQKKINRNQEEELLFGNDIDPNQAKEALENATSMVLAELERRNNGPSQEIKSTSNIEEQPIEATNNRPSNETKPQKKEKNITEEALRVIAQETEEKIVEVVTIIAQAEKNIEELHEKIKIEKSEKEIITLAGQKASEACKKAHKELGRFNEFDYKIGILLYQANLKEKEAKKIRDQATKKLTPSDRVTLEIEQLTKQIKRAKYGLAKLFLEIRLDFTKKIGDIKNMIHQVCTNETRSKQAKNSKKAIEASNQAIYTLKKLEEFIDIKAQESRVEKAEKIANIIEKKFKIIEEKAAPSIKEKAVDNKPENTEKEKSVDNEKDKPISDPTEEKEK